ncbi:MetQ/NlpA family ABC transporter substrate-binding protein [Symbiobacterium terraclitae]|uniref:MetQ/NlpA family ABC transporter substrate-binding protein n=1 Tax=Symbiobacterium terraclitae TaxID=557451 RepID=UPI0035B50F92
MKRRGLILASLSVLIALLTACSGGMATPPGGGSASPAPGGADSGPAGTGEPPAGQVTLRIGQIPTVDGLPFWVAEAQGYYRQHGVDVELVNFRSAAERDAALQGGQIDGALADIIASVTMYSNGARVHITSVNLGATREEGPIFILAAPGSGITSPEQLKGVEVAISTNSMIHYVTEKLLLESGLAQDEIATISIPQIPLRFENLMSGTVKAATLPDPLASLAIAKGATVVRSDDKAERNYSQSVVIFTAQALEAKEEAIRRFFAAYNAAVADIRKDPDAFRELLAEKASLPPEIKDSWQVTPFPDAQLPGRAEVEEVVDWLVAKGVINQKVPYDEIVRAGLY